jgi:hypothetical protein
MSKVHFSLSLLLFGEPHTYTTGTYIALVHPYHTNTFTYPNS